MSTFSPDGKSALDDFIKETLDSGEVPGFVLGVSNVDGEIYFQGGGNNIVGNTSSGDINPDSVFWICSQTKMIAALATLKLIEDGKIGFDTPLGDYLPEFRNPVIVDKTSTPKTTFRPAQTVITVKHLLNFSSGLFYPVVRDDLSGLPTGYTSKDMHVAPDPYKAFLRIIIGELPGIPLKFEPGTDFVYGFSSDALGFSLRGYLGRHWINSGTRLSDQLHSVNTNVHTTPNGSRERIFNPLGMDSCSFHLTPDLKKRLVSLSVRADDDTLKPWAGEVQIMEQDPNKVGLHLGGVGMYSSMRDYLKLLRHIMQIMRVKILRIRSSKGRLSSNYSFQH
ncbi:beta-lactamase/transpeptidase-like protein [Pholiota molesta]|nr:beta-lactamase/transpeptidase-like protein [Pholiota molesta]